MGTNSCKESCNEDEELILSSPSSSSPSSSSSSSSSSSPSRTSRPPQKQSKKEPQTPSQNPTKNTTPSSPSSPPSSPSSSSSSSSSRTIIIIEGPIIIGAGPSGLATAACLHQHRIPSLILERSDCIASLWSKRTYDRLKLHLPKQFCELPLMKFPQNFPKYPSKQQFISYMESYASHFQISPKFNTEVQSTQFDEQGRVWRVKTGGKDGGEIEYVSKWVVVATGENAEPLIPEIQGMEKFEGKLVHTSGYKSGGEFRNQRVLVVGCGNSGMEVCLDLCRFNAQPYMVVRNSVHVLPREMFGVSTFGVAMALLKWLPLRLVDKFLLLVANIILGNTDRLGLRRPKTGPIELKNATGKTPVLDVGALSLIKSGKIKVMEGVKEITKKGAKFQDGQEKEFDSIILATGYKSNVPFWLKGCDFFSDDGMPKTPFPNGWKGGKGLYAVGFTRRGLLGTASDALNVAQDIADHHHHHHHHHQWNSTTPSLSPSSSPSLSSSSFSSSSSSSC